MNMSVVHTNSIIRYASVRTHTIDFFSLDQRWHLLAEELTFFFLLLQLYPYD